MKTQKHRIKDRYQIGGPRESINLIYFDTKPYPGWWTEATEAMVGDLHIRSVEMDGYVHMFTPVDHMIDWLYKDRSEKRSQGYPRVALKEIDTRIDSLREARRQLRNRVPA